MRKQFWLFGIGIVLMFMNACQSTKTSASAKMLKFNFEKGKGYDYEMNMNMDQKIEGMDLKMNGTYYYSMDVVGDNNGVKTINTEVNKFAMKMDAAGFTVDINTDNPSVSISSAIADKDPAKIMNSIFATIKGQKFSMDVSPEGKVLEVRGFENMAHKMLDSLGLKPEQKEQIMAQFNEQFNAEKMKSQFERTWYIFPNKEVKVGDTWDKTTDMASGEVKGEYKSTYKVTDIEGNMVTLEENSIIKSADGSANTSGTVKGTLVVDSNTGLVVSANQNMNIKMPVNGKTIDMNANIKIKGKAL